MDGGTGTSVHRDAIGNIIGRAAVPGQPTLLIGSHLDAVSPPEATNSSRSSAEPPIAAVSFRHTNRSFELHSPFDKRGTAMVPFRSTKAAFRITETAEETYEIQRQPVDPVQGQPFLDGFDRAARAGSDAVEF